LRFDFTAPHKPTEEEVKKIETIINDKIKEALPMRFMIMPKEEALKVGAKSFFKEKYPDQVKVYYIGGKDDHPETAYSKEFCGGPHVTNTKEIGTLEIYKVEKIGSNIFRIYAK
jgi:alanyl-tRNA synthetase